MTRPVQSSSGGSEERNKRKSQNEEKSGSGRKKQKRSKDKFALKIPEYLNYKKNETESEDDSEVGSEIETEAKKPPAEGPEIDSIHREFRRSVARIAGRPDVTLFSGLGEAAPDAGRPVER